MSFTTNKSTREEGAQTAFSEQLARRHTSAPAFNPQIVRSVRMYSMLAACVAAVVLVGLVGFALMQKSVYLAISQVYEEPTTAKILSDPSTATFDANKYENFLGEQIQLIQRLDVLTAAMNSLPSATYQEFGPTASLAAEAIQAQMKVVRVASSYQVSISLKGTDPRKTADIVNAITSAYLATVRKTSSEEYDQRTQLLGEERQRIETELQAARAEQTALGASIGVANPTGESGNPYDAELNGIRTQLSEARAAHDVAAAQLASLSGVGASRADGLTAAAEELIAGDAGLGSMKATISQRKAQLNEQMSGMTSTNPIYKQNLDQIADLDRTLDRMTSDLRDKAARRLQDKLRTDLQRTGDIESRLNGQLARQIANATSAAPRLQRAGEVAADMKRLDERLAAVEDALRSLRMELSGPAQVRLSLPATTPERPEASRKKLFLLLALPLALVVGIAAAILARKQDKHVYAGVDIDEILGFPPIAVLPARGEVSTRVFEEYVLRLAAGIESAYRNSGARIFLFTAVSLTTDIDPLATALKQKFKEIGVNIIVATASDMLLPTEESSATTSNTLHMAPDEMARPVVHWGEGFVAANVAKMKSEHGLVLIEAEAILNCAQTEYVARCADATILVVECGVTTRPELFQAAELLHRLNVTGIGAVLEEVQLRYADVEFRTAIEALDRRQSAPVRPERQQSGPRQKAVEVPAEAAVEPVLAQIVIVEPKLEVKIERQPEPTPEPLPVTLMESERDRVELDYEPAHSHEVLHHVRAQWPTEHDDSWHLSAFSQVPPATQAEVVSSVANDVPTVSDPTVEIVSRTGITSPETYPSDPMNDNPVIALREKITPTRSGLRHVQASDGDASMARKAGWIDKLLRRDSKAVVSIIPDDDIKDLSSSSEDDYERPLANRLAQISGIRPLQPEISPISEIEPKSNLLKMVHQPAPALLLEQEPIVAASAEPEYIAEVTDTVEVAAHQESPLWVAPIAPDQVAVVPEPLVVVPEPVVVLPESVAEIKPPAARKFSPAAWATRDVAPPDTAAVSASEPHRPYTFRELMEMTQNAKSAPVELTPVEPAPVAVEAEKAIPLPILDHVSDYNLTATTVEEVVPEPEVVAAVEPVVVEAVSATAASHEIAVAVWHEELSVPESRPEPPTVWAREPEYKFSEAPKPFLDPFESRFVGSDVYRPEDDMDDIEPVFQAASRSLTSGRWDPIPPLRPSLDAWRDRLSPMPVNRAGADYRKNGAVKDGFNSYTPQRWVPEEDVFVAPEPEPLSEPALTRQWGLLSKFQQSRLGSSGSIPVATVGKDAGRDSDKPESKNGNRQG